MYMQAPVEHIIQLPTMVDPHSASALLTLHGLLFVKVSLGGRAGSKMLLPPVHNLNDAVEGRHS